MRWPEKIFILLFWLLFLSVPGMAMEEDLYFIDAHSQMDQDVSQKLIIKLMDQNGVHSTILASRRGRTPKEIKMFADAYPERIIPSMATKQWGYVSKISEHHKKYYKVIKKLSNSGQFQAMAEVLMWHSGCPNNQCPSVKVEPSDQRVQAALQVAKKNNWPLIAHIEFGSLRPYQRKSWKAKFEAMLEDNPSHPFALIHMGQLPAADVRELITRHPNIYFLTAHANTLAVHEAMGWKSWIDMFDGDRLAVQWQQLVIDHPDRFIFAMDNVWGKNHWKSSFYKGQIDLWRSALQALPSSVAHAIAHGNAERLWHLPPRNNKP